MALPRLARALLCAAALAATEGVHAQEAALTGAKAWQTLVGNTIVASTKAGSYTEFYAPDGSLRRSDNDGATRGTWTQTGDTICFDYPEDDDQICQRVSVSGQTGSFTDPGGQSDAFQILPGNAKNL